MIFAAHTLFCRYCHGYFRLYITPRIAKGAAKTR